MKTTKITAALLLSAGLLGLAACDSSSATASSSAAETAAETTVQASDETAGETTAEASDETTTAVSAEEEETSTEEFAATETSALPDFSWEGLNLSDYVKLGQYEGLTYTLTDISVSDEEVQDTIDSLLSYSTSYEHITEGTVKDGDTVNIDYVGTMDGETFSGGSATDQTATIGSGTYIDGFLESLIGAEIGSTVTADLTFPETYVSGYAGKDVTFEITINYVQGEEVEPEFTDEWVTSYTSGEYTTTEDFRLYIKAYLIEENESEAESDKEGEVWTEVVANAEILAYPEGLVDYFYTDQVNLLLTYANYYSMSYEDYVTALGYDVDELEELLMAYCEKCADSYLISRALAEVYGVSVSEEEYQDYLNELADDYGYTDLDQLESDAGGRLQLEDTLLFDKVIVCLNDSAVGVEAEETSAEETVEDETMEAEETEEETSAEETEEAEASEEEETTAK